MALGALAVVLSKAGPPDASAVSRMLAAAPHRGSSHDLRVLGSCALGVSTQEVTPDASLAVGDRFAAAFVGALDNLAGLGKELKATGAKTPAEITVESFEAWGVDAPARMRGAFAAVVTDGRNAWLFQDHCAFGHVYYRDEQQRFYAATEPKQVVAGAGIAREPDLDSIERLFYGYLDSGDVDRELPCALKGVRRLPRATVVSLTGGRLRGTRYWDPERLIESARFTRDELQERFDELMQQAVARMLTGDDVVSLSGGVDSPAVAAFAGGSGDGRRPVGALSGVYPEHPSVDETRYVELIAEHLQMPLHTYVPVARPLDDIDEWVRVCDSPTPILPPAESAEHYRQARKLGYRSMLTGELAELVFDQSRHLIAHLLWHGRVPAAWRNMRQRHLHGRGYRALAGEVASALLPRPARALYWRYGRPWDRMGFPAWLDERRVAAGAFKWVPPTRERWRRGQVAMAFGTGIGFEADEICEAVCGIRVRRPWTDVDLVEFFMSLPAAVKFPYPRRAGKALVRELLRGRVPDVVLDRQDKTYFNDVIMDRIDYETFRRLLVQPTHRIEGVRYDQLAERLEQGNLTLGEYKWAVDLAKSHAFLAQW